MVQRPVLKTYFSEHLHEVLCEMIGPRMMLGWLRSLQGAPFAQLLAVNAAAVVLWKGLFGAVACPEDVVVLPRSTYNLLLDGAIRSIEGGALCTNNECPAMFF